MGEEKEACWSCMHGRPKGLFITAIDPCLCLLLPLPAPELLPLQLLTVPLLSSQPFKNRKGVYTGTLGAHVGCHPQNRYN